MNEKSSFLYKESLKNFFLRKSENVLVLVVKGPIWRNKFDLLTALTFNKPVHEVLTKVHIFSSVTKIREFSFLWFS